MKASRIVKAMMVVLAISMASICWGSENQVTFSGQAEAVDATVLGINTVLAGTGTLPKTGGTLQNTLASVNIPLVLSGVIAQSEVIGVGDHTEASSTVTALNFLCQGVLISADLLQSQVYVTGTGGQPPTETGSSTIANLVILGQKINVTGKPNQKIALPGGSVIINEQKQKTGGMTVIALHIVLNGIADVQLASAVAGIGPCSGCTHTCSGTPNCNGNQDFLTGAGTVLDLLNQVAAFGFELNNGNNWGGFVFDDPTLLVSFEANSLTGYTIVSPTERKVTGAGVLNGIINVTYVLDIVTNGTQGTFTLTLSSGYSVSGTINLGFLEIQQSCNNQQ